MLDLTTDILDAVDWHVKAGYSGEEFLFSKDGTFPRYIDSHKRPLKLVQQNSVSDCSATTSWGGTR